MTKVNGTSRQGQEWSNDDVKVLRKLFRNNSNSEIATWLERSPKSIERKAARLNLKKTKKYLRQLGRSV